MIKNQLSLLEAIDDEIFNRDMNELFICTNCKYEVNGCCNYPDTENDYCIMGNKKILNLI